MLIAYINDHEKVAIVFFYFKQRFTSLVFAFSAHTPSD